MQADSIIPFPPLKTQEDIPLTDAELVLSWSALLEQRLDDLLLAVLVGSQRQRKRLIHNNRRCLAYCLGLISAAEFADLLAIAHIRNRFAHEVRTPTFNSPAIRCLLGDLIDYPALRLACRRDGRAIFIAAVRSLDQALLDRRQTVRPRRPC